MVSKYEQYKKTLFTILRQIMSHTKQEVIFAEKLKQVLVFVNSENLTEKLRFEKPQFNIASSHGKCHIEVEQKSWGGATMLRGCYLCEFKSINVISDHSFEFKVNDIIIKIQIE
jgi:hypothetical protein